MEKIAMFAKIKANLHVSPKIVQFCGVFIKNLGEDQPERIWLAAEKYYLSPSLVEDVLRCAWHHTPEMPYCLDQVKNETKEDVNLVDQWHVTCYIMGNTDLYTQDAFKVSIHIFLSLSL